MRKKEVRPKPQPYNFFMLCLCIYVLIILAYQTFFSVDEATSYILNRIDTAVCVFFLIDFFWSLLTAPRKLEYLKWGWIDLISSIPMVDALRWGRVARVLRIIRLLRGVRATKTLATFLLEKRAQSAFSVATLISLIMVTFGSIAMLHVEVSQNSNIQTASDALWWSFVTITTVGYGDHYPVTVEGRAVAAVLMVVGVGLFGSFTGFVASWFMEPGEEEQDRDLDQILDEMAFLRLEIAEMKQLIRTDDGP